MKKQSAALATPPNPAKERTTWGDVCRQVGFADNLYRTCRDKLGSDFSPSSPFGDDMGAYDDDFGDGGDEDFDIDKAVRKSALAVPEAPPADWKYKPEGFIDHLMYGDLPTKIMIYGGGALALWFLYDKFVSGKKAASAPGTAGMSALSALAAGTPTSPQSMPEPQISNTAPTTVEIPASLRG